MTEKQFPYQTFFLSFALAFLAILPCQAQYIHQAYPATQQLNYGYGGYPGQQYAPATKPSVQSDYPSGYPYPYPGQTTSRGYGNLSGRIATNPSWTQHLIPKEDRSFDFKTVAKGARTEHRFVIKNKFQETVRIKSVSSSCTCTTATVLDDKYELQTYEETAIVAHFHSDRFDGFKNATITVVFDRPLHSEIQLQVQGEIRPDIRIEPDSVLLGTVAEGTDASRFLTITYAGRLSNWKIVDFVSDNEHLSGEVVDTTVRPGGPITAKVKITLDSKTPKGELTERFYLISNDAQGRRELPVIVRGTVGKSIKVSPSTVFLGFKEPGAGTDIKDVTLRGTNRFRITKLMCDNPEIKIDFVPSLDAPAKFLYKLPIRYTNPKDGPYAPKEGKMVATVRLETDDPELQPIFHVRMDIDTKNEEKQTEKKPVEAKHVIETETILEP